MDVFLKRLNLIKQPEHLVTLRNKILKRIEEYNDDILMTTLFNYFIT